jgi:hypothetical protein
MTETNTPDGNVPGLEDLYGSIYWLIVEAVTGREDMPNLDDTRMDTRIHELARRACGEVFEWLNVEPDVNEVEGLLVTPTEGAVRRMAEGRD